jgi:hypothetical protein
MIPFFIILLLAIAIYPIWYRLSFNIIFWGYNIFDEMRLAIVFYAIIFRILTYPFRLLQLSYKKKEEEIDAALEIVEKTDDDYLKKVKKYEVFNRYSNIIVLIFLQFTVMAIIWMTVGRIFIQNFTPERIEHELFSFVDEPSFPLNLTGWIPIAGMINLGVINQKLNFISAMAVAVVGLVDVIIHQKTERTQLIMLLVIFPAGAFFITSQVPSGFEWSMTVFEALTLVMIPIEKIGMMIAASTHKKSAEERQVFHAQFR